MRHQTIVSSDGIYVDETLMMRKYLFYFINYNNAIPEKNDNQPKKSANVMQ